MNRWIFDTHSHYDDEAFDQDRHELLGSLRDKGVGQLVNVGADMASSKEALALAKQYDFIHAALGVHPSEVADLTEADMDWIRSHASEEKVVAIGEIGLDYHWDEPEPAAQRKWFLRQIQLAREEQLPVIIHSRDAAAETMELLKETKAYECGGVIHCYSYSPEMAQEYVKMGYFIGVGGVVTFKNAKKLKETVKEIPLESIVLETDCPYLAPEPFRGKRNCSLYISYVAEKIAELKGISAEEVIRQTEENAKQLYQINESRLLKEQVIE